MDIKIGILKIINEEILIGTKPIEANVTAHLMFQDDAVDKIVELIEDVNAKFHIWKNNHYSPYDLNGRYMEGWEYRSTKTDEKFTEQQLFKNFITTEYKVK